MYSIKTRLLVALSIVLALTTIATGAAMYYSVQREVDRLLDDSLREVALSFDNIRSQDVVQLKRRFGNREQSIVVQIYDPISGTVALSRRMESLPVMDRVGFSDFQLDGKTWRAYTFLNPYGQIVEAAQPRFIRSEIAFQTAKPVLLPLFVMILLVGLVVWVIIGQGFHALNKTTGAIARRSPTSLQPLSMKGMPREIVPLVNALNDLLGQLGESIKAQQRFASDAAHELRTPLTALTLQIQLAERAKTDEARAKAFGRLKDGVKRATRLVTQLLTMARLDPDNSSRPFLPVDMTQLARSVAEDLSPIAEQKHIHLWAVSETPTVVVANEDALRLLLTNLCDNALRYTPEGGEIRIETLIKDTEASIRVCDNGPGIPEAERERIFERFYRAEGTKTIPGTGLGLAIVRRVAELHGGKPSISEGIGGKGVCFSIDFPICKAAVEDQPPEADE